MPLQELVFVDGCRILFHIVSMFLKMSLGIIFKQADLAKSAPRSHGSMVFEVLTLRFLTLFSLFLDYLQ